MRIAKLKDAVLRAFGDSGADTLGRYFAQIQYSAHWCARMLRDDEGIMAVMPEAVEDLVIARRNCYELHQVKTRNESQGPWTFVEFLPIICQQYYRRKVFTNCEFHFVSNQLADKKDQRDYGGSLYHLKLLLGIKHDGQNYNKSEQEKMNDFENALVPKIQKIIFDKHNEVIDDKTAIELLHSTHIETECSTIYYPETIEVLDSALSETFPVALH